MPSNDYVFLFILHDCSEYFQLIYLPLQVILRHSLCLFIFNIIVYVFSGLIKAPTGDMSVAH